MSVSTALTAADTEASGAQPHGNLRHLVIGAIGVVFGDIGTSPIYTLRESFGEAGGLEVVEGSILGVLSLIFWSLLIIVTLKYVILILRADNRGEGGVLAISALGLRGVKRGTFARKLVVGCSIAGLALFYGDGLITPAISVLSAVEGLETAQPALQPYVLPIAVTILTLLFLIQGFGTGLVGRLFGPVMIVWFGTLAVLGATHVVGNPSVLRALNPYWAVNLFVTEGWQAFVALGAVVLAVTGAEAVYADMGHFGRFPIRLAWLAFVLPALLLCYFGQGAMVLADPATAKQPFFHMAGDAWLWPLIILATCATVIASQAVISGVFSLTRQAILLGYLPRMQIRHTSVTEMGQIYIPRVNWILAIGVLTLVLGFQQSSHLAAAYGVSVTGAMGLDAILAGIVAAWIWRWGVFWASVVFGLLFALDLAYVLANLLKVPHGGWFPLIIAGVASFTVVTWRRGRKVLAQKLYSHALTTRAFIDKLGPTTQRVTGTGVFMTANPSIVPMALLHNLKHNKVLHERVVLMKVAVADVPFIPDENRVKVERLGKGFFGVTADYGFMDSPDVPKALEQCRDFGLALEPMATSFFLGRETLIPTTRPDLNPAEERLFILLSNTALSATAYFRLPPDRVVELGTQVEV
ncbi:MAG: potassium transporter Kup [Geminicoccaceae bacterium]